MTKNFTKRTFAMNIAISFFFAAIFVLFIYVFAMDTIDYYTNLINTTASKRSVKGIEAEYSEELGRLIRYPEYGKRYATLSIPAIDLELPLYNGDDLELLRYGAGQYVGSYFPGEGKTTLIAAHNTVGFFHELDKLVKGDEIIIKANYGTFTYIVDSYKVAKETDYDSFLIQDGRERLILYTCYPINRSVVGRKTERYVVYAYTEGN